MSDIGRASIARGLDPNGIWPLERSSDLFELRYGKALVESARAAGDVPVYGTNGRTGWHNQAMFSGPGVVVGRKGMGNLGVKWASHDYWVIDTAYSLEPRADVDIRFAYYLVNHVGVNHLKHGTSNPSLTREAFGAQYFPVPPLREQQAIAEVLDALDGKIAANTALAATVTQLASTDFAATVRHVAWGPRFEEIADISGGGTPSTKNPALWDGDIWWATPTDMTALVGPYLESTSRRIAPAGLAACSSKLFEPGAILMTSRATIGALAINGVPTALNQGFIAVEPHDPRLRWWLFHEMESRVDEFISWANGATFLELSRGNFKRLPVRVPEETVLMAFDSRIAPLHDAARGALAENCTLAATRDALLPQLMSGKLRVRDAEALIVQAGV